jgi:hypothetical protein
MSDGDAETIDLGPEEELARSLFNGVWSLLEKVDRTVNEDERMVHMAHASVHHWIQVGGPLQRVRGEWQCSRVYAELERAEPALHHARRALEICTANDIGDFDLAYCHEAMARANAVDGNQLAAAGWRTEAERSAKACADAMDRDAVLADLETIPI